MVSSGHDIGRLKKSGLERMLWILIYCILSDIKPGIQVMLYRLKISCCQYFLLKIDRDLVDFMHLSDRISQ